MSLVRSITFQEGVLNAAAKANITEVAIAVERRYDIDDASASERPLEFSRLHIVGTNVPDPVKRVAEVPLT
jgi:hypothetical protein